MFGYREHLEIKLFRVCIGVQFWLRNEIKELVFSKAKFIEIWFGKTSEEFFVCIIFLHLKKIRKQWYMWSTWTKFLLHSMKKQIYAVVSGCIFTFSLNFITICKKPSGTYIDVYIKDEKNLKLLQGKRIQRAFSHQKLSSNQFVPVRKPSSVHYF